MIQTTEHCYIVKSDAILDGEPIVKGSRTPVRVIVEMWRVGVSPEEIPQRLPHLSLSKVFNALSYYLDHQAEINEYIERNQGLETPLDSSAENPKKSQWPEELLNFEGDPDFPPFESYRDELLPPREPELF